MVDNTYEYFCYCCGKLYRETASSTPTQCQCCSSTDIQTQYHKCNFIATADPGVDDDDTEGYCVGSKWINISTGMVFQCVDDTTDAAVWKCATREFDIIENFQQIIDYLPETGAAKKIYNGTFQIEEGTESKESASVIKMLAIASGAASLIGLHTINPANHTYLEFRWKYKQDTADHLDLLLDLLISDPTQTYFVNITTKNSTEITVDIENGVTSDSHDETHNLTTDSEFCIKIKSGEIQFLIDDVLKKSFTGDGIWYDIAAGIGYNYIDISNPDSVSHYYLIDHAKILTGRSF